MDFLGRPYRRQYDRSDFYDASLGEILAEASDRVCSLFQSETGRELHTEVVSLIFENGKIIEIRTDINETIFEL